MANWRFLLFDAVTRQPQGELAVVNSLSYNETLNSPGSFSAVIPLIQPAGSPVTMAMLTPPRAVFAIERDDVLVWAGPIWTHDYDVSSGLLTLSGEGYLSYLRKRLLKLTKIFVATDQEYIAWDLISYTQAFSLGYLGIEPNFASSGVLRDRTYYYYERNTIGELLENLAAVAGGFNFRFVPRWSNGPNSQLVIDFTTYYPATGRENPLVLELGSTADIATVQLDGTSLVYQVDVLGQGTGESMPIVSHQDATARLANFNLEEAVTVSDASETSTLSSYAYRRLYRGRAPIVMPEVTVPTETLGSLVVGDRLQTKAKFGLLDIDGWFVVTQTDVDVNAGISKLTLAPIEVFDSA